MIKAVIVDDEKFARENLLHKLDTNCPIVEVVGQAASMEEAVSVIHKLAPQLVFLDIRLGATFTGFDVLERLEHMSFEVIITTSFDEYAIKAIRANALDYLLKPIAEKELIDAVNKARREVEQRVDPAVVTRVALPDRNGLRVIQIKDIPYCKADDNCAKVYSPDGKFLLITRTLQDVENRLPARQFFRIHRGSVVNRDYIHSVSREDGGLVLLNTPDRERQKEKTELSIARNRFDDFMDWLLDK